MINIKEIKNKILIKENFYFLAVVSFFFFLDRYSKIKIINNFSENIHYINDFINFNLVWNTGIGFGFLSTNSTLVYNSITLTIALVILFLIYLTINQNFLDKTLFSLILGGAIGNFYDRLVYFAVPDFIDVHYNNFHWFTFNVADIFISIGIIFLILKELFKKDAKF